MVARIIILQPRWCGPYAPTGRPPPRASRPPATDRERHGRTRAAACRQRHAHARICTNEPGESVRSAVTKRTKEPESRFNTIDYAKRRALLPGARLFSPPRGRLVRRDLARPDPL